MGMEGNQYMIILPLDLYDHDWIRAGHNGDGSDFTGNGWRLSVLQITLIIIIGSCCKLQYMPISERGRGQMIPPWLNGLDMIRFEPEATYNARGRV